MTPSKENRKDCILIRGEWVCMPSRESESNILAASDREYDKEISKYAGYPSGPPPIAEPITAPACPMDWTQIATDGQTVTFNDQVDVAYGFYDPSSPGVNYGVAYRYNVTGPITFGSAQSTALGGAYNGPPGSFNFNTPAGTNGIPPTQPRLGYWRCY